MKVVNFIFQMMSWIYFIIINLVCLQFLVRYQVCALKSACTLVTFLHVSLISPWVTPDSPLTTYFLVPLRGEFVGLGITPMTPPSSAFFSAPAGEFCGNGNYAPDTPSKLFFWCPCRGILWDWELRPWHPLQALFLVPLQGDFVGLGITPRDADCTLAPHLVNYSMFLFLLLNIFYYIQ